MCTRVFLRFMIAYSSRPQSRKKRLKITVFRPRWREKRSCGRCGCRINLIRKTTGRIGAGEVQSEFDGLGTTHASYVIQNLTKFTDFSAHAAGETFVRPMLVSDRPKVKAFSAHWYGRVAERVSWTEDHACACVIPNSTKLKALRGGHRPRMHA